MEVLYLNPSTHEYEVKSFAWLQDVFGAGLQIVDPGPVAKFQIVKIVVTASEASLNAHIYNKDGSMCWEQPVALSWPGIQDGTVIRQNGQNLGGLRTCLADMAKIQNTDSNGQTGYAMTTDWYIRDMAVGGPGTMWILSPSIQSDGIKGLGMIGGTVHLAPTHIYWRETAGDVVPPPPPTGDDTVAAALLDAENAIVHAQVLLG